MTYTYNVFAGSEGNKIFGTLLKTQRLSCKMSVEDVSAKVCVNPSFINGIERGIQAPSLMTAFRILDAVGMYFLTDHPFGEDLAIYYENSGYWVGFRFKEEMPRQNRHPDADYEPARPIKREESSVYIRRVALALAVANNRIGKKTDEIITMAKAFEAYLIGKE